MAQHDSVMSADKSQELQQITIGAGGIQTGNAMVDLLLRALMPNAMPRQGSGNMLDAVEAKRRMMDFMSSSQQLFLNNMMFQRMGIDPYSKAAGIMGFANTVSGNMASRFLSPIVGGNPVNAGLNMFGRMTGTTMAMTGAIGNAGVQDVQNVMRGFASEFYQQSPAQLSVAKLELSNTIDRQLQNMVQSDPALRRQFGGRGLTADAWVRSGMHNHTVAALLKNKQDLQDESFIPTSVDWTKSRGFDLEAIGGAYTNAVDLGMFGKRAAGKDAGSLFMRQAVPVMDAWRGLTGLSGSEGMQSLSDVLGKYSTFDLGNKGDTQKLQDLLRTVKSATKVAGISVKSVFDIIESTKQLASMFSETSQLGGAAIMSMTAAGTSRGQAMLASLSPEAIRRLGGTQGVLQNATTSTLQGLREPGVQRLGAVYQWLKESGFKDEAKIVEEAMKSGDLNTANIPGVLRKVAAGGKVTLGQLNTASADAMAAQSFLDDSPALAQSARMSLQVGSFRRALSINGKSDGLARADSVLAEMGENGEFTSNDLRRTMIKHGYTPNQVGRLQPYFQSMLSNGATDAFMEKYSPGYNRAKGYIDKKVAMDKAAGEKADIALAPFKAGAMAHIFSLIESGNYSGISGLFNAGMGLDKTTQDTLKLLTDQANDIQHSESWKDATGAIIGHTSDISAAAKQLSEWGGKDIGGKSAMDLVGLSSDEVRARATTENGYSPSDIAQIQQMIKSGTLGDATVGTMRQISGDDSEASRKRVVDSWTAQHGKANFEAGAWGRNTRARNQLMSFADSRLEAANKEAQTSAEAGVGTGLSTGVRQMLKEQHLLRGDDSVDFDAWDLSESKISKLMDKAIPSDQKEFGALRDRIKRGKESLSAQKAHNLEIYSNTKDAANKAEGADSLAKALSALTPLGENSAAIAAGLSSISQVIAELRK